MGKKKEEKLFANAKELQKRMGKIGKIGCKCKGKLVMEKEMERNENVKIVLQMQKTNEKKDNNGLERDRKRVRNLAMEEEKGKVVYECKWKGKGIMKGKWLRHVNATGSFKCNEPGLCVGSH